MTLKVMTWNVENLFRPGSVFGPKTKAIYTEKLDALAATINEQRRTPSPCKRSAIPRPLTTSSTDWTATGISGCRRTRTAAASGSHGCPPWTSSTPMKSSPSLRRLRLFRATTRGESRRRWDGGPWRSRSTPTKVNPSGWRRRTSINRFRSVEVRAQQLVELPRLLEVGYPHPNAAESGRGDRSCIHVSLLILRAFGVCERSVSRRRSRPSLRQQSGRVLLSSRTHPAANSILEIVGPVSSASSSAASPSSAMRSYGRTRQDRGVRPPSPERWTLLG